jgi:acyl-CoA dehydrogenase
MYEEYFTEEHRILRESVRKFVEKEIRPHIDRWEDEELFPAELYKRCANEGLLGLGYPEAYGGTPCDRFMSIVFTEEMIRSGSVGLVAGLGSHAIAMPPVIHLGTEEQKQQFLVPVLRRGPLRRQRRQDLYHQRLPGEFYHHGRPDRRGGIQGGQPADD